MLLLVGLKCAGMFFPKLVHVEVNHAFNLHFLVLCSFNQSINQSISLIFNVF